MAIKGVGGALVGITALKAFSSVVSLVSNMKTFKGGKNKSKGKVEVEGSTLSAAGSPIPVFVTNWNGTTGGRNYHAARAGGADALARARRALAKKARHQNPRLRPSPSPPPQNAG